MRAQDNRKLIVVAVRILGEALVLFRNDDGTPGLIDRRCAHRGADLSLGRLEDGGLRCYFHGWLFGTGGSCMDTPAEPEDSPLKSKVRIRAYPVRECNGNCNWLQALEVGIDPAHASYLHRFEQDEDTADGYGKQFRNASLGTDLPMTKILREYGRPEILNARTEYGQRITPSPP